MKKINTTLILILFINLIYAQNHLVKQWDYRFGGNDDEWFSSMVQTADGSYVLVGGTQSDSSGDRSQFLCNGDPDQDYWIIKIDSIGNKLWDKSFGSLSWDGAISLQQTTDGGFILGGVNWASDSSDGSGCDKTEPNWDPVYPYTEDYWIVKIDSLGNKQWDKRFGGTEKDNLSSVIQTSDGGYLLGGASSSRIGGDKTQDNWDTINYYSFDYWIVKTDAFGNKQWDKTFGGTAASDGLTSVLQTQDGGYLLGGCSGSNISGDKTQNVWGLTDYWIVKIDSSGNKQWDKDFGGTDYDYLQRMQKTNDGGFILAGDSYSGAGGDKTQPSHGGYDCWIIKIDSSGNKQWDKDFGGSDDEISLGSISQTSDGGYLLSDRSKSGISGDKSEYNFSSPQAWILKTDSAGNKLWDKTLHTRELGSEIGESFALQTTDGSYAIATCSQSYAEGDKTQDNWTWGYKDFWIIKFRDVSQCSAIAPVISTNYDTLFSTPAYSYQWYFNWQPLVGDTLQFLVNGGIGGYYYVEITDSNGCFAVSSVSIMTGITELPNNSPQITIFPNPATGILNITIPENNVQKAKFVLLNVLGEIVYEGNENNINSAFTKTINIGKLSPGIYFLQVFIDGDNVVKKIVKE